jgi:hypothetical protein
MRRERLAEDEATGNYGWYAYDGGATVGGRGPEGGVVLRDEELGDPDDPEYADARLTLERMTAEDRFAVTAVLYGGWLGHTARFANEAAADSAYDAMSEELENLADLIPDETDKNVEAGVRALNEAAAAFVARYP